MTDLYSDLDSHYIHGIAREGNTSFRVPLITNTYDNLWQGGCIDGVRLPEDFKYVISLYPWERYRIGKETQRFEFTLYDVGSIPNEKILSHIADLVNTCRFEGKTLVHCQAGLNRSSLVSGLALVRAGMEPREAIELMRQRRSPAVLCNKTFEEWLLTQGWTFGV